MQLDTILSLAIKEFNKIYGPEFEFQLSEDCLEFYLEDHITYMCETKDDCNKKLTHYSEILKYTSFNNELPFCFQIISFFKIYLETKELFGSAYKIEV